MQRVTATAHCMSTHTWPSNPLIPQEKINYFWIVEKKTLEDKKAELRNKERELQVRKYRAPEGFGQERIYIPCLVANLTRGIH